ncbi:MAG: hypothetical protein ACE5GC_01685 [Acidimicrobiia bacterium]
MKRLLIPHLAIWLIGGAIVRIGLVPAEVCPPVTEAQVVNAVGEAGGWIARGIADSGRYTYGYFADVDRINPSYNAARHAGTTTALFQLAASGDGRFLPVAESGLRYMLDRLVVRENWTAFTEGIDVRLGANGLFLAALAQRRLATGDRTHDVLMRSVGRFIIGQQEPDGRMHSEWDGRTGSPVPGVYGQFATGEASWALALLHRAFPDEGWADAALLTARYLAGQRDRVEGHFTRVPDHWAAYTLAELGRELLDETLIRYARTLAGFFATRIRFESQRTGEGINLLVRWFPGTPAGIGTAGEGMGALYRLAASDPRLDDLREGMTDTLTCMAGMMVDRQTLGEEAGTAARPDLARGAWFYRGYSQVDDQQHVISALHQARAAVLESEAP